jgi:hypothetical protein
MTGSEPTVVFAAAERRSQDGRVDRSMKANLKFESQGDSPSVFSQIYTDSAMPWSFGIIPRFPALAAKVVCEGGRISISNFALPWAYHKITIEEKDKPVRIEYAYTSPNLGEDWWSTYVCETCMLYILFTSDLGICTSWTHSSRKFGDKNHTIGSRPKIPLHR